MADSLWQQVGECFDTDDGSLPGIVIDKLSPSGVAAVYAMLRRRSRMATDAPEFRSRTQEASLPVDSVPNAAELVAAGQAEPFHHCIAGVVAAGVELPVLGVFVWQDAVELDYRMGRKWGPAQVAGFFELLRDCCALDPGAVVVPAESEGPPYPDRFLQAWASYAHSGQVEPGAAPDRGGT
jgi:hypothetical protein